MLRSASKILGYRLSARDGEVGRCVDFSIEDQSWAVRSVVVKAGVVKAGARLQGRELLVSPWSLPKAAWNFRRWILESTRAQVEAGALLERGESDTDLAADEHDVSEAEIELSPIVLEASAEGAAVPASRPSPEPTLHSLKALLGCELEARDGIVGHLSDLIVNDDSWTCPYAVVSDSTRAQTRQVLVPIDWVHGVHAERHRAGLSVSRAHLQAEPEFHPEAPDYPRAFGTSQTACSGRPGPAWRLSPPAALASALTWSTRGLRAAFTRTLQDRAR